MALLKVILACLFMTISQPCFAAESEVDKMSKEDIVAAVEMTNNRSIIIRFRARSIEGVEAEVYKEYKVDDPFYGKALEYVGDISPGQSKVIVKKQMNP